MHVVKKLLCCALLGVTALHGNTPYYYARSQSVNLAREDAGWTNFTNLHKQDHVYGTFDGILEFQQSFNANTMAECIFGSSLVKDLCDCRPGLIISGSQTNNRGAQDWLADYFGLATDFNSRVTFEPVIRSFIADIDFYLGLDEWARGLYFTIRAPITQTKWHLDMHETVSTIGQNVYPAGYFSANAESGTLNSFTQFITGNGAPTFNSLTLAGGDTFPATVFQPLAHAKISDSPIVKAGLAELQIGVGWNYCGEDWHVGVQARMRAPTGTRPTGEFAFEPIVGNGHFWEFGGGLNIHWDFWHNECGSRHAGIFIDSIVTHMFTSRQKRTFDLVGKENSRYMLAQRIGTERLNPQLSSDFPNVEFQSEVTPVANLTTMDVDVTIPAQAEIVVMFNYTHDNVCLDLGYNFWGRSCESIKHKGCPAPIESEEWALKGDASVIGFENAENFLPIRLAATESQATIHAGTNFPASGTTNAAIIQTGRTNPNIDAPQLALSSNSNGVLIAPVATSPNTRSSNPPVLITLKDVDFSGAATRGISHKAFANLSYLWWDCCNRWVPYLGLGGEVEFGANGSSNNCQSSCNTTCPSSPSSSCGNATVLNASCGSSNGCNNCSTCSISQWGVWLKGGVSF